MRFQVPQFTEVEDKIIGPLTLKQFIYMAGSVGACIVMFSFLPKFLAFPLMLPVLLFGAALAFYKVNNRPFIRVVESFVKYVLTGKLYIWKHQERKAVAQEQMQTAPISVPKLSDSKLRDLTWNLDVQKNINGNEINPMKVNEGKIGE
jgi:hypothetical protein